MSILVAAACGGAPAFEPVDHVVLVTIDTLRADHLSSFGYPLGTTPFLQELVDRSVVFARAFAHSATTKPSHSSMFTSLYPMQHGVLSNGVMLDQEFRTLAEMAADAGYRTAGFVSADAPVGGNLNQGFDHWDVQERVVLVNEDGEEGLKLYRPAVETIDAALAWLAGVDSGERVFLWLHLYDPHKPMIPPEADVQQIDALIDAYGRDAWAALHEGRGIPVQRDRALDDVLLYDAELHYVDRQLRRMYESMAEMGFGDEALWVVTSDHGQGLGAHDWFGHSKQIYNAQLHVPLLFHTTSGTLAPRAIDNQVAEHVDILPTIAEILGFPVEQILPVQGVSLVPHLLDRPVARPKWFAYAERSRYVEAGTNRRGRANFEEGARYAIQDVEYKYILFTEGPDEFYDLRQDPYEMVNLVDSPQYADKRDQMLEALTALLTELPSDRGAAASVSEEDLERLRALGYIQ